MMIGWLCGEISCVQGQSGGGQGHYFEGRVISQGDDKFLQGGGAGNSIVWFGTWVLGTFGFNGKEDREYAHDAQVDE